MSTRRRTTRLAARILLLFVVAAFAPGCRHFGPGMSGRPCPVEFVPADEIDASAASMRARIHLQVASEEVHLELITQRRRDELLVVGLARFGVRLFAVHQRGREIRVDGAASPELEQIATWVMDALHRAVWIVPPPETRSTLVPSWNRSGERVRESRPMGKRRREFFVSEPPESGREASTPGVTIDYLGPPDFDPHVPSAAREGTISISNPWCGYEATIAPL